MSAMADEATGRIRELMKKAPPRKESIDINQAIRLYRGDRRARLRSLLYNEDQRLRNGAVDLPIDR
jgi:hypothetical protein